MKPNPKTPNAARVLFFDCETTNLNGNFGYLLCISYKFKGGKINTIKITDFPEFKKDPTNDKKVVEKFAPIFEQADMVVGWYSKKFDEPYINSRLLYHNLHPLASVPHIDAWWTCKSRLKLNSNRLASASAFLGVEEKTPLNGRIWVQAMAGHKNAINYVVKHCEQDIVVLEQVYERLLPLIDSHPNVNVGSASPDACPKCGTEGKLHKRGYRWARVSKTQRFKCNACGGWSLGKIERIKTIEIR